MFTTPPPNADKIYRKVTNTGVARCLLFCVVFFGVDVSGKNAYQGLHPGCDSTGSCPETSEAASWLQTSLLQGKNRTSAQQLQAEGQGSENKNDVDKKKKSSALVGGSENTSQIASLGNVRIVPSLVEGPATASTYSRTWKYMVVVGILLSGMAVSCSAAYYTSYQGIAEDTELNHSDLEFSHTRFVSWFIWGSIFSATIAFAVLMYDTIKPLLLGDWAHAVKTLPFWILARLVLNGMQFGVNWLLFRKWPLQLPPEDYQFLLGNRDGFPADYVESIEHKYGARNIKIVDAMNRRWFHICTLAWRLIWYTAGGQDLPEMFKKVMIHESYTFWIKVPFEQSDGFIGRFLLGTISRSRDGRYGRLNLVTVGAWNYLGLAWCFMLASCFHLDNRTAKCFFITSMQGVMWGDTFAEIIGSFFGKWEFRVYGLGDVNKKTVEGCLGCFVTNFASMWTSVVLGAASFHYLSLCHAAAAAAFTGTVAETWAPRGTDNAFILICVMMFLVLMRM